MGDPIPNLEYTLARLKPRTPATAPESPEHQAKRLRRLHMASSCQRKDVGARAGRKAPRSVASRLCRHARGRRLLRRQRRETAPARHKGPGKTSDKASATPRVFHPLCARRARAAPLPPRGGPFSSGLIRPALLTQETGRRGPLSVPNRCPLSRFPRTCPAPRACARRPRPDALFARTAGGRLVAEALYEVLPGPLCLAVQIRHSVLYRAVAV